MPAQRTAKAIRIGYARTSTARQELVSRLEALHAADCQKVIHEQISTRIKIRPELEAALKLAHQFKEAAPDTPVIFTVHELKRLARNAAELMTLSAELQAGGIQLELLTGSLTGIYDPNGMGAMFFAVLAVAGQIERNYIQEKTLEGQVGVAKKGNHGGRPKVIDSDMLTFALALKDKGVPVPDIAKKLTIKTGKNKDKNPSVASLYRVFAEAEQETEAETASRTQAPKPTSWSVKRSDSYARSCALAAFLSLVPMESRSARIAERVVSPVQDCTGLGQVSRVRVTHAASGWGAFLRAVSCRRNVRRASIAAR
ncbi:recombinase family protein [Streptomyces sp. NPDC057616]|uniref:recombinase family protein n=1 Tax=Streptomyces sp. NPDC057616 TaxID=3346183 RepID=UPI0036B8AF26